MGATPGACVPLHPVVPRTNAVSSCSGYSSALIDQKGSISPLLIDVRALNLCGEHHLVLPGEYLPLADCSKCIVDHGPGQQLIESPVSSPPCSPCPSSADSTPYSCEWLCFWTWKTWSYALSSATASLCHELEVVPSADPESTYDTYLEFGERLSEREALIPGYLLEPLSELGLGTDATSVFDEAEFFQLENSVLDKRSPSLNDAFAELPNYSPLPAFQEEISRPSPDTKSSRKGAPIPSIGARRSHRRASSASNPYPSPHSLPSSPSLGRPSSAPNSTPGQMASLDHRALYSHSPASSSSLALPPRGHHASNHGSHRSLDLRPLSPSLAQRTLALERAHRTRARSTSPFAGDRSRRSSSHSRSGAFAHVPPFLAQPHGTAQSAGVPKSYRLRGASFNDGQPTSTGSVTQRTPSMVRRRSMSGSSGDDADLPYRPSHESFVVDRGRRASVSTASESSSLASPPRPPLSSYAPTGYEKHVAGTTYYEGQAMAVDHKGCGDASEYGENVGDGSGHYLEGGRLTQGKLLDSPRGHQRRSSYPSHHAYPQSTYSQTAYLSSPPRSPSSPLAARSSSRSPSRSITHTEPDQFPLASSSPAETYDYPMAPIRRSRRGSHSPVRGRDHSSDRVLPPLREPSPTRRPSISSVPKAYHVTQSHTSAVRYASGRSQSRESTGAFSRYRAQRYETEDDDIDSGDDYDDDDDDDYRGESSYRRGYAQPLRGSPLKGCVVPVSTSERETGPRGRSQEVVDTQRRRSQVGQPPYTSYSTPPGTSSAGGGTRFRPVGTSAITAASEKRRKGEKKFICAICKQGFTTNQNCQSSYRFSPLASLETDPYLSLVHERKHKDERPYQCACGYGSASRSDLKRHLSKKNPGPNCRELPVATVAA